MHGSSFEIEGWAPWFGTLHEFEAVVAGLQHLHSSDGPKTEQGRRSGQTLWSTMVAGQRFGIGWGWGEVATGLIALADPMRLRSNIQLVGADGLCLHAGMRLLHLNNAVNSLNWQEAAKDGSFPLWATKLAA